MADMNIKELLDVTIGAIKEERRNIAEELYMMQLSSNSKLNDSERSAYNMAMRIAADYIISRNK